MPRKPGAIGRAVVYYARAAQVFSAEIKCRHLKDHTYAEHSCEVPMLQI